MLDAQALRGTDVTAVTLGYGPSSLHDGPRELQVQTQTELAGLSLKHFLLPGWREILHKYARLECNYGPNDCSASLQEGNSDS